MEANMRYVVAFLVIVFSWNVCGASCDQRFECPATELSGLCQCFQSFGNVYLRCKGVSDHKDLLQVKQQMKGYDITTLEIYDSNLKYIPYDLFVSMAVSRITISNSTLFYLFNMPLEGAVEKSLTEIRLQHVSFTGGFDWSVLENLEKLQLLSVTDSELEQVEAGVALLSLPVETLILSQNGLEDIYEEAFGNFVQLKNLKLNNNLLNAFDRKFLPYPTSDIQLIDLSYNKLTALSHDVFDGMPSLHSLILHGNKFSALEEHMKKIWNQLFFVSLSENPLTCDCQLAWILQKDGPFHLFGDCVSPSHLIGRKLADLEKEDFKLCSE